MTFNVAAPLQGLRQVSWTSRWQPTPAVYCRHILCRAAAKQKTEKPHLDSQSRAYNEVLLQYLDEVSGERETGISRKADGVDEEELLQAAAEALHKRVGSTKGMAWCMDVIQKSFMWRHVGPGRRIKCPELPTVDMVESRLQGLLDLSLTDEAVSNMLSRMPTLLGYQSRQLQAMREYLAGLAGFSSADVASLLQKEPRVLSYSVAGTVLDVVDFLRGLGIEWEGILEVLLRQPRLLGSSVDRTLKPAVSMLTDMGFSRADIARRVVQQPHLLACKPERYEEVLHVMQKYGVTSEVAKKALTAEPGITTRSVNSVEHLLQSIQQLTDPPLDLNIVLQKTNLLRSTPACLAQMAQWLRTHLQLSEKDLRLYLSKSPSILTRSSELVSRRAMDFAEAGFTPEDFKHIACRQPAVFGLSFQHNVRPKLRLLRGLRVPAAGEPLTGTEVRRLVVSYPTVLTLSLANIESKLKYLVVELKREGREILTCPPYLASSMEGKIVPRATYLQALGMDQQNYKLSSIFTSTDAAFCKTLGVDLKDFTAFKSSMRGI